MSRRMIDPSFWQSETVARLPISARYLFIGLFSNADDQGRMKANVALIRAKVFPLDDIGLDAIAADLDKLEAGQFILRYETNGSRYLQVVNWWKYQRHTWAMPSELPAPEGWTDRACYRKGNVVVKSNWPDAGTEPDQSPVGERMAERLVGAREQEPLMLPASAVVLDLGLAERDGLEAGHRHGTRATRPTT